MKALYTAATGMRAQQTRIDNIANNLANVSTTGFKKSREAFEDLLYQSEPVAAADGQRVRPSTAQVGSGTRMVGLVRDFGSGDVQHTGNPWDLALGGRGFFVLESSDGTQMFTRDGTFRVNADGELVNQSGFAVSPGITVPEGAVVSVAQDGTVLAAYPGSTEPVTLGTLEIVDFLNPAGLAARGGNVFVATPESGDPQVLDPEQDGVTVQAGFLEASNVDVAEELVGMIVAQRSFELTSKVIQTADETLSTVVQLKR